MITTKDISANIVSMAAPMKSYWKTIWKDANYTGCKESSFQKLAIRKGVTKSSLQKQNTTYVHLLSSTWTSKAYYVNKTPVSHHHGNPSLPNTNITYHVGDASTWNAMLEILWNTPTEYGGWCRWKVFGSGPSRSNHQ